MRALLIAAALFAATPALAQSPATSAVLADAARAPANAAERTTRPGCTPTAVVDQSPSGCRLTLHSAISTRPLASSETRQNQPSISVPCEGSGFPNGMSAPVRR